MQYQLAAVLQVRASAVSHWEAGRRKPREDTIDRIGEVLNIDPNVLRGKAPFMPLPAIQPIKVPLPRGTLKNRLTRQERHLLMLWRALNDRQRDNLEKLIQMAVIVTSKAKGERN